MKNYVFCFFFFLILLSACQKDKSNFPTDPPQPKEYKAEITVTFSEIPAGVSFSVDNFYIERAFLQGVLGIDYQYPTSKLVFPSDSAKRYLGTKMYLVLVSRRNYGMYNPYYFSGRLTIDTLKEHNEIFIQIPDTMAEAFLVDP